MQNDNGQGPANGNWTFHQEGAEPDQPVQSQPQPEQAGVQPVTWTASEFVAHHKSSGWYFSVAAGGILIAGITYLLTRDLISLIAIIVVTVLFLIISTAQPQQKTYYVGSEGIKVGDKLYTYAIFKSFSVQYEGALGSISFMPLKRFMPELTIYYAPDDEHRIVDVLASFLPNDQRPEHGFDSLIRKIRF